VTLNFPDFSSTDKLDLNGQAEATDEDLIRLTDSGSGQEGTVFTENRVLKPAKSFKTDFRFELHSGSADPADGIAFLIHREPSGSVGGGGGGMGYANIDPSVAIEFDIYLNPLADPDGNHVGVTLNGEHDVQEASAVPGFDLYGDTRRAWVNYSARTKRTKVYVSATDTKPDAPIINFRKNLNSVLEGSSRVGFTAATGGDYVTADLLGWKLRQRR
jgi:hypothetical protein